MILAALIMLLTTIPYLIGVVSQNAEWQFSGFLFGLDDGNSYLAKMLTGASGAWQFNLVYTTEPHDPLFIFVPYLLSGKLAALSAPLTGDVVSAMLLVFHGARIGFGVVLLLVTYRFASLFLASRPARTAALVLIALGGGFGWLLTMLGQDNWLGSTPVDFIVPEGYTFYLLYGLPHLSLARAGMFGGLMLIFTALRESDPTRWGRQALLAGACWLVMGLCVPFYIPVLYLLLGLWGLAAMSNRRRFPAALFVRCVVASLVPAPYLLYTVVGFAANPVMSQWQGQNVLPSPHPLHYVVGYGLLAVLALPMLRWAWQRGRVRLPYLLLPAWVAAAPFLVYLPINVQRRLLEGVFVPLVILAVAGLRYIWSAHRRRAEQRQRWRLAMGVTLILLLPTTALILVGGALGASQPSAGNRVFIARAEIAALDWLAANAAPDAVVLANTRVGNYAPARANVRSYVGHGPETLRYGEKAALATRLLRGETTLAAQPDLIAVHRVAYVVVSPEDYAGLPDVPLRADLALDLAYKRDGYLIFRVRQR
jgi:hypothetical protein